MRAAAWIRTMEQDIDKEIEDIEDMLKRSGKTLLPGRARFHDLIGSSITKQPRPLLSPLTIISFMNTASKTFVAVAALVVAGAGIYFYTKSTPSDIIAEKYDDTASTSRDVTSPNSTDDNASKNSPSSKATQSPATVAIDDIEVALQSDVDAQLSSMNALDESSNSVVSSVDTANSSKQPYDENSI